MFETTNQTVQRLWNFCNVLKDDGVSYGDYVEQLTYLLFLKMDDESHQLPACKSALPAQFTWRGLKALDGPELEKRYLGLLQTLGEEKGLVGAIFHKAQNKIRDTAKLKRLIDLIDAQTWSLMHTDVKGQIYEGLLAKNAEDIKSGAGQYFTPRPLIRAIIKVMRPTPDVTICDPACGTGGFFLAAHQYITENYPDLSPAQRRHVRDDMFRGWEIVENTARLCLMNLYLHGIAGMTRYPVIVDDALITKPSSTFDMVLTNPPFGKKSSMTFVNGNGRKDKARLTYERDDFIATTSNKQLNFVQHVKTLLKPDGRAAVVVPDNVLFEGGAGEAIRRNLLHECDVHTLLRLPTGIFYANGVKANVLFFDRRDASEKLCTKKLWVYDLRSNQSFTLRTRPMQDEALDNFIGCYHAEERSQRRETQRFRCFAYGELVARDRCNLDISWPGGNSQQNAKDSPSAAELTDQVIKHLEAALKAFRRVSESLKSDAIPSKRK
jgi:type I restriction enzyme M protein